MHAPELGLRLVLHESNSHELIFLPFSTLIEIFAFLPFEGPLSPTFHFSFHRVVFFSSQDFFFHKDRLIAAFWLNFVNVYLCYADNTSHIVKNNIF